MANLRDAEAFIELSGASALERYRSIGEKFRRGERAHTFEQVQYALAVAHNFYDSGQQDGIMFVGSLGVLGNVVNAVGIGAVTNHRDIHDLDLLVRQRHQVCYVDTAFDRVVDAGRSPSIPNKMVIQGLAVTSKDVPLFPTHVDILVASEDPYNCVSTLGTEIRDEHWEGRVRADFFGIPVYCAPPVSLLKMKLAVACSDGQPRQRDCEDVTNLAGVIERTGIEPRHLKDGISLPDRQKLSRILKGDYNPKVLVGCTKKFRRALE